MRTKLKSEVKKPADKLTTKLNFELHNAAEYMQAQLPQPIDAPIKVIYRYIPSLEIGGDSFGYHFFNADNFIIYLIDVAGMGVSAALHSNSILHVIHHLVEQKNPLLLHPERVLKTLNDEFQMDDNNEVFFTIWYGVYDKKNGRLSYATGGHHPAVLLRENKQDPFLLKTSTKLMGIDKQDDFAAKSVKVVPHDVLYLFSDGVFELEKEGINYTFEDFVQFLQKVGLSGNVALDEIEKRGAMLSSKKPLADDFSILQITF